MDSSNLHPHWEEAAGSGLAEMGGGPASAAAMLHQGPKEGLAAGGKTS